MEANINAISLITVILITIFLMVKFGRIPKNRRTVIGSIIFVSFAGFFYLTLSLHRCLEG